MAITATIVDIRGKAYEPVIEEILFENKTVEDNLVAFETDVKSETIFTENTNTVNMQAYTSGQPSPSGSIGLVDTLITPVKVMFYDEFAMETLRSSRFKRDMKAGAWNTASSEFEKSVLLQYGKQISLSAESNFWNGLTNATATAVAALTAGTANASVGSAEQTYIAAVATANAAANTAAGKTVTGFFDGIITKLIYNNGGVGSRIKVAGTTITATNIAGEYAKLYAAIPAVVLNGGVEAPFIYAPYSHKQLINIFNVTAVYRDLFSVSEDKKTYFYNGVEIKFVPIPENTMVAAIPSNLIWCTDLINDINYLEINKIQANRDDMFIKNVFTLAAHVVNQKYNVLYKG